MANEQNLIPLNKRSKEDIMRISKMGSRKSADLRKARKTLRQDLMHILDTKAKNGDTFQENMTKALITQALKGNVKAYEVARDTIGEEQEFNDELKISLPAKWLARSFSDLNRMIDDRDYLEYWLLGGRSSTKSTFWGDKVIELLTNNPNMCCLCTRKVANTLQDSVWSQLNYSIEKYEEEYPQMKGVWKSTKSPLKIENKQTGQIVYFRGADEPNKIKSIRPPKDKYIGIVVHEEFDQLNGMTEIRTINQSLVRGGEDFVVFNVCNTPKSLQHFVNKEKLLTKDNRYIHESNYLDVPVKWIGQPFIEEAEHLKEINQKAYEHEYLGKAVGLGGVVFENIEIRDITDEEINTYDYIYQGMDFGWFPDPLHFGKMWYNSSRRELHIFFEYRVNKKSNEQVHNELQELGIDINELTTGDSAEPKSIGDFKMWGWNIHGAKKGPGSVHEGIKWLQGLSKIVIDNKRCPATAEEFISFAYEKDKDGNDISSYPDMNNHSIDMVRYALERIWKRRGN